MKKYFLAFFALLLFAGCEKESVTPATLEADTAVDFRSASKRLVLHNTGSSSNPWEVIEVSDMAYQKAHQGHGDKVVGDAHADGIIFYLADTPTDLNGDGKPDLGLVAATADPESAPWGCNGNISGADGTGVGTGRQNTDDILAGCNDSPIAASLARAHNGGGYTDWFLPSKDELNLMYENLHKEGLGGFASVYYWSSTEFGFNDAWLQSFSNGGQSGYPKSISDNLSVRAVRAF